MNAPSMAGRPQDRRADPPAENEKGKTRQQEWLVFPGERNFILFVILLGLGRLYKDFGVAVRVLLLCH